MFEVAAEVVLVADQCLGRTCERPAPAARPWSAVAGLRASGGGGPGPQQSGDLPAVQAGSRSRSFSGNGVLTAGLDGDQTVAAKVDDGVEHLLDDTRYDAPTFSEKCGRSSMSGYVNQGAMNKYGNEFLSQMRVIDGDEFAIDAGDLWFKGCDTGATTFVCEMKKP
jgi:hypothetical protein